MTGPVQFDKSILDRYPYPLARPARELEHAETPEAQLRQLEIMAEMTVRYLGCIALANYLRDGVRVVRIQHLLNRLDSPEWDIWLDLLSSLLQHYSAEPSEFVAQELIATYNTPIGPETDIFKACQFLAENANLTIGVTHKPTHVTLEDLFMLLAEMHKAGWSGRDASKWVQVCFPAFAELLKRLSCLQNYPLAYLANVEVTEKKIEYHLDVYMGSSDSAQRKDVSNLPEGVYLDPQQVYLCDANLLPLLGLHPLLIVVAQKLHILYQNRNDEQIIYVQCGTLSPYQPESPGYSIGGMALGGGDVKTMTQSMRPHPKV